MVLAAGLCGVTLNVWFKVVIESLVQQFDLRVAEILKLNKNRTMVRTSSVKT